MLSNIIICKYKWCSSFHFKKFSYHKSKMYLELCIVKPLSTKQRGLFQLQMEESRSCDVLNTLSSDTTKQIRVHSMDPSTRQHALRDITHTATSLLYITRSLRHETFLYLYQKRVLIRVIENSFTIKIWFNRRFVTHSLPANIPVVDTEKSR